MKRRKAEDGGRAAGGSRPAVALVLLVPLLAMQVTDEVDWSLADFAVAGALVVAVGVTYEMAAKISANTAYRAAVGVALAAAFLLIWVNLAVGIIGTEDDPANLMFVGVLAVGIVGAVVARLKPAGMARALVATALVQGLIAIIAAIAGMGLPASPTLEILGVNTLFLALWLASAWLFRKAARRPTPAGAAA